MRARTRAVIAGVAIALAGIAVAPFTNPIPAQADDSYPSWDDVVAAQNGVNDKPTEINNITALLAQLADQVTAAKADLDVKAKAWQQLDAQYTAKSAEAATLKSQADAAQQTAVDAEQRAGQWAAQTVKIGGSDPTLSLFSAPDDADQLLNAIGVASRISEQANALYEEAIQQANTAQSLTDQATVMQNELQQLDAQAQAAMAAAQAASEALTQAQLEQQQHEDELQQQLNVLQNNLQVTQDDYNIGQQKQLAAQLANLGIDWAQVSPDGWVKPAGNYYISAGYGWDPDHLGPGIGEYHYGVDLAQSCGNPIIAAHSGTVVLAGWDGGYGNAVVIDHGGGLYTLYGHQPYDNGIVVSVGQSVQTGQLIGHVGSTGQSTGCHLHFGVYVGGYGNDSEYTIDPISFMAANGVYL